MVDEVYWTVTELTDAIRDRLENHEPFRAVMVEGEVSNLTRHTSGHYYFSLKDERAQLNAVMFKGSVLASRADLIKEGDSVLARGAIGVYTSRGQYQLQVHTMRKLGQGALFERFLALKEKLAAEGLFDDARKRPIPADVRRACIITSPTGAVIRDIIQTVRRRGALVQLLLIPATVQGDGAPGSLIHALESAEKIDADVTILARGGGSLEDLWAFNDEGLARAIAAHIRPVISAVGHETDFSISDFAADLRASTPTAAAELVSPEGQALRRRLDELEQQLCDISTSRLRNARMWTDELSDWLEQSAANAIQLRRRLIDELQAQAETFARLAIERARYQLARHEQVSEAAAVAQLNAGRARLHALQNELGLLDPQAALARGFAVVEQGGRRRARLSELAPNAPFALRMADGVRRARLDTEE